MFDPSRLAYLLFGCCGGAILGIIIAFILAAWIAGTKKAREAWQVVKDAENGNT